MVSGSVPTPSTFDFEDAGFPRSPGRQDFRRQSKATIVAYRRSRSGYDKHVVRRESREQLL